MAGLIVPLGGEEEKKKPAQNLMADPQARAAQERFDKAKEVFSRYGSPMEAYTDPVAEADSQRAGINLLNGTEKAPADVARAMQIARRYGVPTEAIVPNQSEYARRLQTEDNVNTLTAAPRTRGWLADNPDAAALAQNDIDHMSRTEMALDYMWASTKAGTNALLASGAKLLETVLPGTSDEELAVLFKDRPEELKRMREESAAMFLSRFARERMAASEANMKAVSPDTQREYGTLQYATTETEQAAYLSPVKVVSDALRSLPTTAAMAVTAYLTRGQSLRAEQAALASGASAEVAKQAGIKAAQETFAKIGAASEGAVGFAQQAVDTQGKVEGLSQAKLEQSPLYQQMISQGFDPYAARVLVAARTGQESGIGAGAVDAVTNLLGGKILGKVIGEGGSLLPRVGKGASTEAVTEFVQSAGEQVAENISMQANVNPDQSLGQDVLESALAGLFVGGLTGGVVAGVLGRDQQVRAAEDAHTALQEIDQAVAAAESRALDPETFRQFAESVEGAGDAVYIDGQTLLQSGRVEELVKAVPEIADQLEAAQLGTMVRIPMADYLTNVAGTELNQAIMPELRVDPNGMTFKESQEYNDKYAETLQQEVAAAVERKIADDAVRESAKRVEDRVFQELQSSGRWSDTVNRAYATLWKHRAVSMASRLNMTPEDFFNQRVLKVRSESMGGREFDQPIATVDAGDVAVTDQVDEATGLPLNADGTVTLYHHTSAANAAAIKRTQTLKSAGEPSVYLTTRETPDTGYGDTVVKVRIDPAKLQLDDEFPDGRRDFSVDVGRPGGALRGAAFSQGPAFDGPETGNTPLDPNATEIEVDGVMRPAQNSNGQPIHPTQEGVRNFWRWFGDSKVVDDQGRPLVVYHGSRNGQFSVFERNQHDETGIQGVAFAPDKRIAIRYANDEDRNYTDTMRPEVYAVYLKSDSVPLIDAFYDALEDFYGKSILEITQDEVDAYAKQQNINVLNTADIGERGELFAILPDGNIKSATGNVGTFDPNNANILMQSAVANETTQDQANSLTGMRVSPRLPTAVKATEDALAETRLQPDLETAMRDAEAFEKNIDLMSQYPNFKGMRGKAKTRAEKMINAMVDNLMWLHDHWAENYRARSRMWYVGGNRIAHRWAARFGVSPQQVAGIIAATSPQKDWYQNVSLAERILEAVVNNADMPWDDQMSQLVRTRDWGGKKSNELGYTPVQELARFEGKSLKDLADPENPARAMLDMAVWIRAWDESHNPQMARVITPEGGFANKFDAGKTGKPVALRWQSFATIAKTLQVLAADTPEKISQVIGANHKVRSFYNNIVAPFAGDDVTIDTHAVAAALIRPLASSDIEVFNNFGSGKPAKKDKEGNVISPASPGTANSSITGLYGTYSIYAEAYRRAAKKAGLLPREMQSITWEAIRGLFRPEQKQTKLKTQVDEIWKRVAKGEVDINAAREEISKLVGGVNDPAWVGSPAGTNEAQADSSYAEELPGAGLPRGGAAALTGRLGRDIAAGDQGRAGVEEFYQSARLPDTIEVDGQQRSTTNSNGQLIATTEEGVRAFWRWFGDSKVVDDQGRPLVVYHGSPNADLIDAFDAGRLGDNTDAPSARKGFFFAKDPRTAKSYANMDGSDFAEREFARQMRELEEQGDTEAMAELQESYDGGWFAENLAQDDSQSVLSTYLKIQNPLVHDFKRNVYRDETFNDLLAQAQQEGLDGAVFSNVHDGGFDSMDRKIFDTVFVAFDPTQIKSAVGNQGMFNPASANIFEQPARGSFNPETNTIALLKAADLSTFLHESGHFFLETQFAVAADLMQQSRMFGEDTNSPGEQSILDDTNAILRWFGINSLDEWFALDFEEKRAYHEKWAESFEAYLLEGKAPSIELQGVFNRFASWLKQVYKSIKDFLAINPAAGELTDEIRAVMDRMLATDEQIAIAQRTRSLMPLFATPEQAATLGVTIQDFQAYQQLGDDGKLEAEAQLQSRAVRDMKWLRNARSKRIRQMQREAKETRAEVRMVARREIMSQPVYQAWQFLTGKMTKEDKLVPPEVKRDKNRVQPSVDSLFEAIAKLGGLDFENVDTTWGWDERIPRPFFGKPLLRRDGKGKTIDEMAEALSELGYLAVDMHGKWDNAEFEDLFDDERRGKKHYSILVEPGAVDGLSGEYTPDMTNVGAGRLDYFDLRRMTIPDQYKQIIVDLKMTAKEGGYPVSAVAEKFGFASAEDMVRELGFAEDPDVAIEALTDAKMLEEYGDLSSPEAIEEAADKALHNDMLARMVTAEANALARAVGKIPVMERAAREAATALINRLAVRNVKPYQYAAAAARAGKAADKAFKGGDVGAAADEKRNQTFNVFATKAAYDALDEYNKAREFFRRVLRGKDDDVAKSRDMDLVQAARSILAGYGYGGKAKAAIDYVKTIREYDADLYDMLDDTFARLEANAKPLRELTIEEVRTLRDEIESLWNLAKRMRQSEVDGDLLDREDIADELNDRMTEIGVPDALGVDSALTPEQERSLEIKGALSFGKRVEFWVDYMDGLATKFGAFRRFIFTPIKEAADRYRADRARYVQQFRDALTTIAPTMKAEEIAAPELGYTFGKANGGVGLNEVLHAILHTGNESNKRKLLLGRGWATENADGSVNTSRWDAFLARMVREGKLTREHFDFAQTVWDILESMKPAAQKAHREAYGKYFAEVTADSFDVTFPDGTTATYRGGYVPAKVDPLLVKDNELKKLIEEGKESMAYSFPSPASGFTKSRTEYNKPLLLDLRSLAQHIDSVLLFSHMKIPARDVAKLLAMPAVSQPLNRLDPAAINSMLMPWLQRSATQRVSAPVLGGKLYGKIANALRARTSMATMFANVMNATQQVTGFMLAAVKVKPKYLAEAMGVYLRNPSGVAEQVSSLSTYMENRMFSEVQDMMNEIERITVNPSILESAQDWTTRHMFFLQTAVDNVMGPIIWMGAYNEALATAPADVMADQQELEKYAQRLADAAVRQTQGSTLPEDVSRLETGSVLLRPLQMFMGYFNMQANLLGSGLATIHRDMGLRRGAAIGAYVFMLAFYAPALVAEAIALAFRGGPEDDEKDGYLDDWLMQLFLWGPLRNATAMVPYAGQAINSGMARFNGNPMDDRMSVSPVISTIEAVAGVPYDLYKVAIGEPNVRQTIRDVGTATSVLLGVPGGAVARPAGYVGAMAQERVAPTGPADLVRGLVTGVPSAESRQ